MKNNDIGPEIPTLEMDRMPLFLLSGPRVVGAVMGPKSSQNYLCSHFFYQDILYS